MAVESPDFRELFETAPGLHLVLRPDPARTIVAVSNSYLRATKTQRAEILGRGLFDVFPDNPDDPQATGASNLAASIDRVLLHRAPDAMAVQKYDIRRPAEEGGGFEERWWSPHNAPVLGPDGEVRYVIHRVEDVTDYVRLQRSDRELQARAQHMEARAQRMEMEVAQSETVTALVRSAVDGIVTIDENGIVHSFNPAAERMFGWAAHEVIGRNVSMLMPSPYREQHDRYVERYLVEGRPRIIGIGRELEGVTRQGRTFPMHLAVSELSIGGRRMFAGFVRDMTERKQLEEQFLHSQKMEAVGALTSGVAHDFGNLLMGITGCANIALGKLDSDHPIARYLRELSEAAKRGTGLIRQLMSFSRKQAPTLVPLALHAVIDGCTGLLRRLVGDDIDIEIRSVASPAVVADAGQLEQVLVNLVVNARDAMPAGGRITISTEELAVDERGAEARGLSVAGRYVALAVADTGHGMDESTRLRVFEPFFTTKEVGKGTGLGLATVYAIVQQLRGSIGVQSEPGRGTTFTMLLPAHEGALAEPDDHPTALPTGRETVLIVDDDRLVRLSVRHYLEVLGYHVVEALEPSDALRLGRQSGSTFDLLLTDVVMPGIGGRNLAKRLRELHPTLGVLFMSAHPSEELVARGSLEPGDEVLNKPFSQDRLAGAVRRVLDASREEGADAVASVPAATASASILMVEDNGASRMVIGELLTDLGHHVLAVTNAADALEIVERSTERIDVVLTDVSLPDMLGNRLVERIREVKPLVPVVYMSGYDSSDVALGPNDTFLTKPFELDDLVDMVENAILRGRALAPAPAPMED
jgi:PAS domain S-box-containing protein